MALSIVNNVSSLNAQTNLNRHSSAVSKSLQRLSSGLKIDRGADGPAALVISEQQRAQITGLRTAIDNVGKSVNVVKTAEDSLNEINKLLNKARSLALDSSNSGVNDDNSLAANQSELDNVITTIGNIAERTQFGGKKLLDGSASGDNKLTFQTGANAGQTASLSINSFKPSELGKNIAGNQFGSLSEIKVTSADKAKDAVAVIDNAISQVTSERGSLGAFQANTLEANANNLRAALEETVSAESTIRDTDFASELASFTKNQVLLQAGSTVLGNANQIPSLVASLLRG